MPNLHKATINYVKLEEKGRVAIIKIEIVKSKPEASITEHWHKRIIKGLLFELY